MNRREFSKKLSVLASTACPLLATAIPTSHGTGTSSPLTQSIESAVTNGLPSHAVYDARLALQASVLNQQLGVVNELHTYHGDVTSIWYQLLDPLWAKRQIVTAGITRHTEFFILRTLAGERGHTVSYLEEHDEHTAWVIKPSTSSQHHSSH